MIFNRTWIFSTTLGNSVLDSSPQEEPTNAARPLISWKTAPGGRRKVLRICWGFSHCDYCTQAVALFGHPRRLSAFVTRDRSGKIHDARRKRQRWIDSPVHNSEELRFPGLDARSRPLQSGCRCLCARSEGPAQTSLDIHGIR